MVAVPNCVQINWVHSNVVVIMDIRWTPIDVGALVGSIVPYILSFIPVMILTFWDKWVRTLVINTMHNLKNIVYDRELLYKSSKLSKVSCKMNFDILLFHSPTIPANTSSRIWREIRLDLSPTMICNIILTIKILFKMWFLLSTTTADDKSAHFPALLIMFR